MIRQKLLSLAVLFCSTLVMGALFAQDSPAAADSALAPKDLATLAKNAYDAVKSGEMTGAETVCMWSRRWMAAEYDAAQGDSARLLIKEAYAKRADDVLSVAELTNERAGGPFCGLWQLHIMQYYALQAHQELDAAKKAREKNLAGVASVAQNMYAAFKIGFDRGLFDSERFCVWSQRWMAAEYEAAVSDADRALIMEAYAKRADEISRLTQKRCDAKRLDVASLYAAQYYALQAHRKLDTTRKTRENDLATVAQKAYGAFRAGFENREFDTEDVCAWSRRWMTAEYEATECDLERVLITEAHAKRANDISGLAQKRSEAQSLNSWPLYTAQYYALQAHRELDAAKKVTIKKSAQKKK